MVFGGCYNEKEVDGFVRLNVDFLSFGDLKVFISYKRLYIIFFFRFIYNLSYRGKGFFIDSLNIMWKGKVL